ncbi:PREDICTED: uncharacterized protein LOC104749056 [Camelina sativa]|uniref:Uncharacterized protein LOC104749056 n=1 Tax=Camelina sativa TaxID=90675 RepID=A0ABM1R206_CAMSA|nr:PREDICTED: uncharacterized protein LOC104749056 [Camelina sativa]
MEVEKSPVAEKQGGEDETADATKEAEEQAQKEAEDKEMSLEEFPEYEKILEEKKKARKPLRSRKEKLTPKCLSPCNSFLTRRLPRRKSSSSWDLTWTNAKMLPRRPKSRIGLRHHDQRCRRQQQSYISLRKMSCLCLDSLLKERAIAAAAISINILEEYDMESLKATDVNR